jgi:hypothetical protein
VGALAPFGEKPWIARVLAWDPVRLVCGHGGAREAVAEASAFLW